MFHDIYTLSEQLTVNTCTSQSVNKVNTASVVVLQDPSINITELKEIHSEINLTVPDPILLSNLHDGLDAVRLNAVNDA